MNLYLTTSVVETKAGRHHRSSSNFGFDEDLSGFTACTHDMTTTLPFAELVLQSPVKKFMNKEGNSEEK